MFDNHKLIKKTVVFSIFYLSLNNLKTSLLVVMFCQETNDCYIKKTFFIY